MDIDAVDHEFIGSVLGELDFTLCGIHGAHMAIVVNGKELLLGYELNKGAYDFIGGMPPSNPENDTKAVLDTIRKESLEELCVEHKLPIERIVIGARKVKAISLLLICNLTEIPIDALNQVMAFRHRPECHFLPPEFREMASYRLVHVDEIRSRTVPCTSYVTEMIDEVMNIYDEEMQKGVYASGNIFENQFNIAGI